MKETEKLKLKLPEISDWADIVALNDNFQALDSWLEQLKSDIIAKLNDTPAKDHTHTRKDITDFPTSLPASDVYDWAKQPGKPAYTAGEVGARPNTWTPKLADVAFLGNQPISAVANDTTANWVNLGSGYAWYSAGGLLNDQPAQYGFLLNYVNGSDVFQIWNTQSNGPMFMRSGNASGWGRSWTKLIDSSTIGSQTVNKAKYASITTPGTASLKNIKAGTSDLTAGSSSLTTGDIYLVYE